MHINLVDSLRRVAFFSLVTAPAQALFAFAVILMLTGSPTGRFIEVARSLVGNAAPGEIMACEPVPQKAKWPPSPPERTDVLCKQQPVDASQWIQQTDRALLDLYLTVSLLGFLVWVSSNFSREHLVRLIRRLTS
jgi:hypothetical protein